MPQGHYACSYSRWGNAGQLQQTQALITADRVIADGGMRANCNANPEEARAKYVIADGGMRANCN